MGRGKLPMVLIENQKARKLAMEKRKISLKKKAHELSTLCDVPVCVIMYNADDHLTVPPLLYPENRDEAQAIINRYVSSPKNGNCSKRRLNLEDVVQGDIKRRRIGDSTSPNLMSSSLEGLSRNHLSDMASILDHKLQFIQNRINAMVNYVNHGQISGGTGFDQELGLWSANCFDHQPQQEPEVGSLPDENSMLYSGSQFCSADQQQLMGSSLDWEAVLGFHTNGSNLF